MAEAVKILVVDDDPYLRDLLIETLSTIGYDTCSASDAGQALDVLKTNKVELVITDIKMPGMNGIALAETIRKEHPGLPLIFITGVFTPSIVKQIEGQPILSKPFRIGQLEELINQTISGEQSKENVSKDNILVVEDDDSFRLMLLETLKLSGYSVQGAAEADEALKILAKGEIGAVITDVKMPGMNGLDLSRHIKHVYPQIPVILVTAYLTTEEQKRSAPFVDGFLMKPFKVEAITGLLEEIRDLKSISPLSS